MTRRFSSHHLRDERGQALVVALLVMILLGLLVPLVLSFAATNNRTASYSQSAQKASSLAEAGVNDAANVLAAAAVPTSTNNKLLIPNLSCTSTLLPSSESTATSVSYTGGTVKYWGYFDQTHNPSVNNNTSDCQNWVWTLKAKSTVPNPTGAAPITKVASAQVQVNAPTSKSILVNVWNTVYSPQGPTPGVCDTSIGQGITISVPVYVGGNLCMGQNAVVTKSVYVGGFLTFQNKQGHIGSNGAGNTITSAHVGSYCQVSSMAQVNPCKSEPVPGNQPNTNIWVTGAPTNLSGPVTDPILQGIAPPLICWGPNSCTGDPVGGWYSVGSPGPFHPCEVSSGTPPTFDTDTTMNNSVTTVFNLTPTSSYTCKTAQGELSWNASTRQLIVSGTVYIDGSITMTTSGNQPITYTGSNGNTCTTLASCQAVIYASGDISINSEMLCAVVNSQGTNCDWNNWNPNNKILIFASNGPTGITVGPSQTSFQGGLYATNTVATGQSALTEGPLVSGTKTVVLGQQFGGTFPSITILPMSVQQPPGAFYLSPAYNFS
jgi:Tfp pilus assembly protein PilX